MDDYLDKVKIIPPSLPQGIFWYLKYHYKEENLPTKRNRRVFW